MSVRGSRTTVHQLSSEDIKSHILLMHANVSVTYIMVIWTQFQDDSPSPPFPLLSLTSPYLRCASSDLKAGVDKELPEALLAAKEESNIIRYSPFPWIHPFHWQWPKNQD